MKPETVRLLDELSLRLGATAVLRGDAVDARYGDDASGELSSPPGAVIRPASTEEVAAILSAFDRQRHPIVIQGGRTGLAGATQSSPGDVVLSLERMTAIEPADPLTSTITVDAGATLQAVDAAAETAGLTFGVDIGSRGSATIGGAIATNAGGVHVMRYGMMRAQVLGVEAVLADGSVISGLRGLHKDNSGYDLGQLIAGSEGTLGVVTRACLRLHPRPASRIAAFGALGTLDSAFQLLSLMRGRLGPQLSAFEVMIAPLYADMVAAFGLTAPVPVSGAVHALVEVQGFDEERDRTAFADALEAALEAGLLTDAVLAQSDRETAELWGLRDACSRYCRHGGPAIGIDLSVALPRMPAFLKAASSLVSTVDPAGQPLVFGHLGDGNLHYIVRTSRKEPVTDALMRLVAAHGGSISAEHGIGLMKKAWLPLARSEAEIDTMRRLKRALDPNGILNPGRIFDMTRPETGKSSP